MKEKILIVDDEKDIVRMIDYSLRKEGFCTCAAYDGEEALEAAASEKPSLMVLDVMLPGMSGWEVCRRLRADTVTSRIPVIMLTAKAQEADKIVGLELGADDYMTKPFSPRELVARIKAVLRRGQDPAGAAEVLRFGALRIDLGAVRVFVKDAPVTLTAKEFALLVALARARGRVLSREYLLDTIWGFERAAEMRTRTVDVHIRTLRKKLRSQARCISTVKSHGYRFDA